MVFSRHLPCAVCSSGRQWRCAAAGRAGAAGTCAAAVVCRDPAAEGRDTSGAAPAGGRAAAVVGKSCRDADHRWVEGACVTVGAKVRLLLVQLRWWGSTHRRRWRRVCTVRGLRRRLRRMGPVRRRRRGAVGGAGRRRVPGVVLLRRMLRAARVWRVHWAFLKKGRGCRECLVFRRVS